MTSAARVDPEPLRIGILGAARIAELAIVKPARATGTRLVTVAARDGRRAEAFAAEQGVEQSGATPATYVLAAGFAEGVPFIVDIDPHGLIGRYEEVGFHAVGSGAAMAQQAGALLAHFRMTERDVDYGVVAVVRILDTLRMTSPSIGGPVDVYRITADEATALSDKDIDRARKQVQRWSERESQVLDGLFVD